LPKNNDYEIFYYSIQTKVLRNESNLIVSFKLHRILNSLKFHNYLVQTHSKGITHNPRASRPTWQRQSRNQCTDWCI